MSDISFPDTFIYSTSWEDPDLDQKVLKVQPNDSVLTITGGGDNVFNYVLNGAGYVCCVDLNPAQYHLMELKMVTIQHCDFDTVWRMFGTGILPNFDELLTHTLSNHLKDSTTVFWKSKLHYFTDGLYLHGSMGKVINCIKRLRLRHIYSNTNIQKSFLYWKMCFLLTHLYIFSFLVFAYCCPVLWMLCGVPNAQKDLITKHDKRSLFEYVTTSLRVFLFSDIVKENYFYYLILNGQFERNNCPKYLKKDSFESLKKTITRIDNLNCSIMDVLRINKFDKIVLMDHMDWMDESYVDDLCRLLSRSLLPNGKIIVKSSSLDPPFIYDIFVKTHNFKARKINTHTENIALDRVNMYASFWLITKDG